MVNQGLPTSVEFVPRVALFADTFFEANGVGTLSRQLAEFARAREFPLLVVRGGKQTCLSLNGSLETLELKRSVAAFPVDKTLYFDPLLMRHKQMVIDQIRCFKPDLIHITGPGDIGFLGVRVAHELGLPSVASWHTNLHEYLSRRLYRLLNLMPRTLRDSATRSVEQHTLQALMRFYKSARFTLAPNQSMVDLLQQRNGRPSHLMLHGVDLERYKPAPCALPDGGREFCIGYVGRLTTEKNVQALVDTEQKMMAAGEKNYRFLIVGEGGQESWLRSHLQRAELTGVLHGDALAAAYQRMDVLVFPSQTDTFGLVLLEAMASGVPVVLTAETGKRVRVEDGISGLLSSDFAGSTLRLMHEPALREAMGKAAHAFACTQGWDMVFTHLYQTYEEGLRVEMQKSSAV